MTTTRHFPAGRALRMLVAGALALAATWLGIGWQHRGERVGLPPPAFLGSRAEDVPRVHLYGNPAVSVEDIAVRVVFFSPNEEGLDAATRDRRFSEIYRSMSERFIPELAAFHAREFRNRSQLRFAVLPRPFIGRGERSSYELEFLDAEAGNPLRFVEREIGERILSESGDVYDASFAGFGEDAFQILLVVYDAAAPEKIFGDRTVFIAGLADDAGRTALVFRPILDPDFSAMFPNASTIIEHEILHALGVPEQYDLRALDVLASQGARSDIMGRGVLEPIFETAIGRDVKEGLGLRD